MFARQTQPGQAERAGTKLNRLDRLLHATIRVLMQSIWLTYLITKVLMLYFVQNIDDFARNENEALCFDVYFRPARSNYD